jgi:hypothetical protein
MKKVLNIVGITLISLLTAGVVLSLVAPKKISVTSTQFVRSSTSEVYNQIRFMKNFPNWSPYRVQDPHQKYTISGNDGNIGATFSWEGVSEQSKGYQKIVSLSENKKVSIRCKITEPFESSPSFDYDLVEKDGGVEVVQNFEVEMPAPVNAISLLLGLRGEITALNQQGLSLLKKTCEQKAMTQNN